VFWEKFYATFLDLASSCPNLYSDISALSLPNRMGMLLRLRRHPALRRKLLFGTDYPLRVFCWAGYGRMERSAQEETKTTNRFDRQYALCRGLSMGFRSIDDVVESVR